MEDKKIMASQENDELMRIIRERQDAIKAAEQERLDAEIKCEEVKHQMYLKKVRHMLHSTSRVITALTGAFSVITLMYLLESNTLGVLISTISTFGLAVLSNYFDKRSRKKW